MKRIFILTIFVMGIFPMIKNGHIIIKSQLECFAQTGLNNVETGGDSTRIPGLSVCNLEATESFSSFDVPGGKYVTGSVCDVNDDCSGLECNTFSYFVPVPDPPPPPPTPDPTPPDPNPVVPPPTPPAPYNKNTDAKMFNNPCDGLKEMWANSLNPNGTPYKEAHGFLVDDNGTTKFILMPQGGNTVSSADFPGAPTFSTPTGPDLLLYNGHYYKITAAVHTHPDPDPQMYQGPTIPDDYNSLNSINIHGNDAQGIVISNGNIYSWGADLNMNFTIDRQTFFTGNCPF